MLTLVAGSHLGPILDEAAGEWDVERLFALGLIGQTQDITGEFEPWIKPAGRELVVEVVRAALASSQEGGSGA